MTGRQRTLVFQLVLASFFSVRAEVTQSFYLTSSIMTRSLAMGGAFTAVRDGVESSFYNPAALIDDEERFRVGVDPVGLIALTRGIEHVSVRTPLSPADYLAAAGMALRFVSFTYGPFQAIALLSEELADSPFRDVGDIRTAGKGIVDWNHHIAAFRLTPAQQISLGASLLFFNLGETQEGEFRIERSIGSSYGIFISPTSRFSVGATVFNLPQEARSALEGKYQVDRQDVNFGLSWLASDAIQLAMDFRKVTQEDSTDTVHFHGGVELTPFSFLALRAGYFRESENKISAGFGLGQFRRLKRRDFIFGKIMLNYCLQTASSNQSNLEHRLALLIRL
ncbi:MAG: hypothetical protein ONB12_09500 [candidate division KSB1 bacterium]|nr:hypothetical protein [candidate division KSB1 bacterium]